MNTCEICWNTSETQVVRLQSAIVNDGVATDVNICADCCKAFQASATTTTTHRPLTDAEVDRLHKLHNRLEDARNFTASSKALAALNAYEHRLMRSGVSIDAIAALPRG